MTTLPAALAEAELVETVGHWVERVAELLTSDAGHSYLRTELRARLRQGTIPTMQVVAAAEQGHRDADLALRELGAEMLDRGKMPPAALRAYLQRALVLPPVAYPPGRNIVDTWTRDIGIAVLVALAVEAWRPHLPATRNRASRRPSASSIVASALARRGHPMGERQVERIYREHNNLAARLSASIPVQ